MIVNWYSCNFSSHLAHWYSGDLKCLYHGKAPCMVCSDCEWCASYVVSEMIQETHYSYKFLVCEAIVSFRPCE